MMCALGMQAAEAYANYTPSNTTLTFYYDNLRSTRTGKTYSLNTGISSPDWFLDGNFNSVTRVVFNSSFANARPTSTSLWFYSMRNLQTITGISYLNTSEVTQMPNMFYGCVSLTSLDLSHFNTANVRSVGSLFSGCSGLTRLDLSSFNTAKVTYMNRMFYGCNQLQTICVGDGWSTAAVTSSEEMFYNCTNLAGGKGTTYDANHVDAAYAHVDGGPSNPGYFTDPNEPEAYACYTSSNTTLTFYYDKYRSSRSGTTYDLNTGSIDPGWYYDGSYVTVTKVVFNSSFANARPTTTSLWFYGMRNLQSITGISYLNTSEVTLMSNMFYGCVALTSLDLSHFNTANVKSMGSLFSGCSSLTRLDLSSFNTAKVTNMKWMFSNCSNLKTIYVGNGWSTVAVTSSDNMFYDCTKLVGGLGTTFDANHLDKAYAHIDNGPYDPGYLSDINSDVFYEGGIFYQIRPGGTTVYVTQGMDNIYEEYIP